MKRNEKTPVRLWAVGFWLLVWQAAGMALGRLWTGGHLLLATPLSVVMRLGELAVTAEFWQAVGWSSVRIFGGFLLASLLAAALAVPAARYRWVRELLGSPAWWRPERTLWTPIPKPWRRF